MKNKIKQKTISGIVIGTMLGYNIVPAYATYWDVEGDEAISGIERSALVTYNPSASFMVSVPKTIVLDTKTKSADYNITVKGGIENRTEVVVAPKDNISNVDGVNFYMFDKSIHQKEDVVANVTQESTEWSALEVTESGTTKKGTISAQDISYGDWSGNLIFMIKLCEDHEHTYENGICTECGKTDPNHEHNYTETITKAPTCTEDGEKTLTCNCGDIRIESIPSTGHKFENGSCTECGEADPNHTHSYTETVTKEATCTEAGEKTLTCACGDSKIESIPATGHNFENGKCIECGEADPDYIADPYSLAPEKAYMNWNYTLDETNKTITLNYYSGSETDVIVYSAYPIDGTTYRTKITSNPDSSNNQTKYMFNVYGSSNCQNIKSIIFGNMIDVSDAKDLSNMFSGCSYLTNIDLSNFDTRNVTDMTRMFYNCSSLTSLDLSNFDTKNVINMSNMFCNCNSLTSLDLSNFDTRNVTDMSYMFRVFNGNSSLISLDLSNFDTSKVTTLRYMFDGCSSLTGLDVSNFNTRNVTDMSSMFDGCSSLTSLDLSNFDTSNVIYMSSIFDGCSSLTSLDLSNFDTSNVTDMRFMFSHCSRLMSLDVSNFDTSKVTNMMAMFDGCSSLTSLDLSNFDTSKVTTLRYMFASCSALTSLDLRNFDTHNATDMYGVFYSSLKLKTIYVAINKWVTSQANITFMFYNCGTSSVVYK